jgi:hypothetical protein
MPVPTTLWCTDEDLALRAAGDFALLCPKDQALARGADGVFNLADLWTLSSATNDFLAQGVAPGNVVQLSKQGVFLGTELFGVSAVTSSGVTLKRKGLAGGIGLPSSPYGGANGVSFAVLTLQPQIVRATYDLDQKYGIDDLIQGRRSSDVYDPQEVLDATVLMVLWRAYEEMARHAGDRADHFAAQAKRYNDDYHELLGRAEVHWKPAAVIQETSIFDTRLVR